MQGGILLHQRSSVAAVGESEQCEDTVLSYERMGFVYLKASHYFYESNLNNSVWQLFSVSVAQASKRACAMASM